MSADLVVVDRTRKLTAGIIEKCVRDIRGKSERAVRDEILAEMRSIPEIYERGWYDPPPFGVSVLFGGGNYKRLQYDSLRNPKYLPQEDIYYEAETVAQLYLSPVDKTSGLFGDFDCTVYSGKNENIRLHMRAVRDVIITLAEKANVGMSFRDLYVLGQELFKKHGKVIGWMATVHDPLQINLGHTMPGSYEGSSAPHSLEEIIPVIGKSRIYINAKEQFIIPQTCALTVEARLTDTVRALPNVMFHVIVCFSHGKKMILANFDDVFKAAGMEHML